MIKNLFMMVLPLILLLGCGGYDTEQLNEPDRIEIVSESSYIVVGGAVQYSAIGYYDNGTTEDLTEKVYWTSDNSDILLVDNNGLVYGKEKGLDTIYVSWNNMVGSKKAVEVKSLNRLVFDYPYIKTTINTTHQNNISVVYDDLLFDREVELDIFSWHSDNPDVATVDDYGLITTTGLGRTKITATIGETHRSVEVFVHDTAISHIEIVPNTTTVLKGLHTQYRAYAHYCDGYKEEITYAATWSSGDIEIASVELGGIITTQKEGNTNIYANYMDINASEILLVNNIPLTDIYINTTIDKISKNYYDNFYVIGFFEDGRAQEMRFDINWSSSNPHILEINEDGKAYGANIGIGNIQAYINNVSTTHPIEVVNAEMKTIEIIPSYAYLPIDYTLLYTAKATFEDGRINYVGNDGLWDILNSEIASINITQIVTAHREGKALIEFIYRQNIYSNVVTVTP